MLTTGHVWREAQERLRPQMTRAQFDTWLRGTRLAALERGAAVLAVRTTFVKELLETQLRERIEAAIAEVTGRPCMLEVVVGAGPQPEAPEQPEPGADATPAFATRAASRGGPVARERHATASGPYARPGLFDAQPDAAPDDPPAAATPDDRAPTNGRRRPPARDIGDAGPGARDARAADPDGSAGDGTGAARGALQMVRGEGRPAAREGMASMQRNGDGRAPRDDYGDGYADDGFGHDYPPDAVRRAPGSSGALPVPGGSGAYPSVPQPRLNPRYTFRSFIVGKSNQLAYAASVAVGEAPGQEYNPLFLYGGVGLGKTHLLHAIGHTVLEKGLSILYVTSEKFTNDIINAIRYRTTEEFRAKYRSVDVLLVDDIQFIAGKDSTEEEFFHTFNSLYESGSQIVICSDRPPKAIVSLEERLRSRFEWGLIADVQPPDFETRVAILRAKAEMSQRNVPDDVIAFLADQVPSNIRELEGSLNRLLAFSTLQRQPLTIDTAKAALANLATDARKRRVTIGEVLAAVAEFYRLSADDLRGKQRDKHIVVPRQVAMYLMRQETESSLMEIGNSLGGRDHSTVLHGCDKISREVNENTALRKEVMQIRQRLLG